MGISSLTSAEVIAGSLFEKRFTSSDAKEGLLFCQRVNTSEGFKVLGFTGNCPNDSVISPGALSQLKP